jgi:hypothetical protein
VLTIQETGMAMLCTPDEDILSVATKDGRAVLTLNRKHFRRLHAEQSEHAGIIACTYDPNFDAQADRIHAAVEPLDQLAGRLVRVNRPVR